MPRFFRLAALSSVLVWPLLARAGFVDDFDGPGVPEWQAYTGDGTAQVRFVPHDGFARIQVDATSDPHNVWWAIIKRDVTASLDLAKLQDPEHELRVEARVRGSHAPRRVNFMINTQRTTNYHEHLREYDLPDATGWHTISMTTENLDVRPGDTVFVQLGVTDWGPDKYAVDVDYYRAEVVRRNAAGPDQGEPLIYHPPVRDPGSFAHHLPASQDSVIDAQYPDVNFNDWQAVDTSGPVRVLSVTSSQSAVLRWDFAELRGQQADGAGVLELTTCLAPQGGNYVAHYGEDLGVEFGKIRVIEILAGDPAWKQDSVTYRSLLQGQPETEVFNPQMIFDVALEPGPGSKTYITLSRPVMQRLLDGRTTGLVLRPLGATASSIYAAEAGDARAPKLHFSTRR